MGGLFVRGALRLDIDFITGETRGETGVLALLADGERELAVRHDHAAAVAFLEHLNGEDLRRGERRGDVLLGILAVFDDIDLLAACLLYTSDAADE